MQGGIEICVPASRREEVTGLRAARHGSSGLQGVAGICRVLPTG